MNRSHRRLSMHGLPDGLPPTAGLLRVFREQLRTALHGWSVIGWISLVWMTLLLLMAWSLGAPAWVDQLVPHEGYLGWSWLAGAFAVLLLAQVWRPSEFLPGWKGAPGRDWRRDAVLWRSAHLAEPIDRRTHDLLRAGAGAVWAIGLFGVLVGAAVGLERAVTGNWPSPPWTTWLALPGSLLFLYLLLSVEGLNTGGDVRRVSGVIAAGLLVLLGVERVGALGTFVRPALDGPWGLVTAAFGGDLRAVLLWGALAVVLLVWRAGRMPAEASGAEGRFGWWRLPVTGDESAAEVDARPAPRDARGPEPAAGSARVGEAPPVRLPRATSDERGMLPAPPRAIRVLREEVRILRDEVSAGSAVWALVGALLLGGWAAWMWAPHAPGERGSVFLANPYGLLQAAAMALALTLQNDWRALAPSAFGRDGALPHTRRGQVISRVVARASAAVFVGLVAYPLMGLSLHLAGFQPVASPGAGAAVHAGGLILVVGLAVGFAAALSDSTLVGVGVLAFGLPTGALLGGALIGAVPGVEASAAHDALALRGWAGGDVTQVPLAGIAGWIFVLSGLLWLAAGRRPEG